MNLRHVMHIAIFPENPWRPLALFIALYLAFALFAYLFQRRLLYFPGNYSSELVKQFGLKPWPTETDFRGLVTAKPPADPKGVCLVWHGNAGAAFHRTYYIDALERRGYRVILLEYPGYGGRAGELSESAFVADALAAVDLIRREFQGPIYLVGESLGCAVAAAVARERDWVKGVMLITPWATLPDLAQAKYWYLPARWFVRDRYDSIANLAQYRGPVAVLMAENDEIVPRQHSQRLFDSLKSPKRLWIFPAAGHNTWPSDANEKWWDEVLAFLQTI